jgi:hypothetical protein
MPGTFSNAQYVDLLQRDIGGDIHIAHFLITLRFQMSTVF